MSKIYSAKIGTIPALIMLRYNYKLRVGQNILWRYPEPGFKYEHGTVDNTFPLRISR